MRHLILLAIIVSSVLQTCDEPIESNVFGYGEENNFRYGITYTSEDSLLRIRINEITDSRCPVGVVCVWQGEARVKIETQSPNTGEVNLSTFHDDIDTLDTWSFRLIDVKPAPVYEQHVPLHEMVTVMVIDKIRK